MSKHRLLLADDSITIQKVVNLTFADEGIEVTAVGDGDAALIKIGEFAPDLVMADVNMPGLNGYQICEKIKQDERLKLIPVILLVGSFEPFDEAEAKRVGADDFMTKPFQSIRQLVNKVSELLERGAKQPDAPAAEITQELNQEFINTLPENGESFAAPTSSDADDEMIETSQVAGTSAKTAELSYDFQNQNEKPAFNPPNSFGDYQTVSDFDAESGADFTTNQMKFADENQFAAKADNGVYAPEFISETIRSQSREIYDFGEQPKNENAEIKNDRQTEIHQPPAAENFGSAEAKRETDATDLPIAAETKKYSAEEIPAPALVSALNFDDFDLLELPPLEAKLPEPKIEETPAPVEKAVEKEIEPPAGTSEIVNSESAAVSENKGNTPLHFSPEVIEAIAQRVVEKLSEKFFDKQD